MHKQPAVSILSGKTNGALCTGVTWKLVKRIWDHRNNPVESRMDPNNPHTVQAADENFPVHVQTQFFPLFGFFQKAYILTV